MQDIIRFLYFAAICLFGFQTSSHNVWCVGDRYDVVRTKENVICGCGSDKKETRSCLSSLESGNVFIFLMFRQSSLRCARMSFCFPKRSDLLMSV